MDAIRQMVKARFEGASALRVSAVAVTLGFVGLMGLFIGGDAVTDPGGWAGIGGTALWVLAMLGLLLLALYRPGAAMVVLVVAACAPLAFGVWSLVDYGAAHGWEDSHGPLSLVLVMSICAPAAVVGLVRPRAAGALILTVSLVPLALAAVGAASQFLEPLSVGLVLAPLVASGIVFLWSARQPARPRPAAPLPRKPVPH